MRSASRASLAEARDRLDATAVRDDAGQLATLGDELFAVTTLLDRDAGLRRALSDPSRSARAKAGLARALLSGKISDPALDVITTLVSARWSAPGDLADATEELAVRAIARSADVGGRLDDLEDELFRFGRIVEASPELHSALTSQLLPAERRTGLARALLEGKVTAQSLRLITQAVTRPRGRSLDACLQAYGRLAAQERERLVAEVHVAIPLTDAQRDRLAAALAAAYGHEVHLNVVLDPKVIGGMSVLIGDDLIDGSTVSRLAELRRRLAG